MDAFQQLKALGDNSDAVAKKLTELGIRGYRGSARVCPIASYLLSIGYTHVIARPFVIIIGALYRDGWMKIATPNAIRNFIYDFDTGFHSQLVKE
jgi:hypothetical protein